MVDSAGDLLGGKLAFCGATFGLGRTALHVRFNTDARALDGSSNAMLAEERAFFDVWGDMRNRALVLVQRNFGGGCVAWRRGGWMRFCGMNSVMG